MTVGERTELLQFLSREMPIELDEDYLDPKVVAVIDHNLPSGLDFIHGMFASLQKQPEECAICYDDMVSPAHIANGTNITFCPKDCPIGNNNCWHRYHKRWILAAYKVTQKSGYHYPTADEGEPTMHTCPLGCQWFMWSRELVDAELVKGWMSERWREELETPSTKPILDITANHGFFLGLDEWKTPAVQGTGLRFWVCRDALNLLQKLWPEFYAMQQNLEMEGYWKLKYDEDQVRQWDQAYGALRCAGSKGLE
ncbi:uncharacterized protein LTR77_001958 [Saxophila tyrrhenica]|uniref:Uncharacterized protein n=1 Tax=Saxophila tyrrhenica TaxID=1690608 RepID=A0AAV9PJZ7_9PEZI|nr:hypothetical protein LTR77_001958 [Saxophila tyrrhenica]